MSNLSTKSQSKSSQSSPNSKPKSRSWSVYLILSTNTPIKTYVGVSTDFSRRVVYGCLNVSKSKTSQSTVVFALICCD
ncbi:hypothetical protein Q3G72_031252 [Acer saccharum]|nr:hypothetical protein Q3G72_031252 [Acer saccharum]